MFYLFKLELVSIKGIERACCVGIYFGKIE